MPGRSSRCSSSSWRSRRRVSGQSRGGGAGSPRMLFCVSRGRVDAGEEPGPGLSLPANRRQHCSSNMTSHHIYVRALSPGRGGAGDAKTYGGWSVGDRGGGTSSPSLSAPPPVAISPRSSARGDPGKKPGTVAHRLHPGHGFPPGIATHGPRPAGATRSRNMDCVMLFPPFGISLPQHAFLVTGMCEACGTTWRTLEV